MNIEMLADYACVCGEGPLWHPEENAVYWTDIPRKRLFRYDVAGGRHEECWSGRQVGGFTLQADGALLLFMDRGTVAVWRRGRLERTIVQEIPDEVHSRFNDVIADPAGRVFCGTMPVPATAPGGGRLGRLYRLDCDGTLTRVLDDVGCSNGMGFTPDRQRLYFTDSQPRTIDVFDYDQASGTLRNRRNLVTVPAGEGVPDGMTVDAAGDLWSGRWDGGVVVRYSPAGLEKQRIALPARKVSCVTFGGPDYTDMYLTTAGGNAKATDGPLAGGLFRIRGLARGVAEFRSRIGL